MTTIDRINHLDRYSDNNEYTLIVQFTIGDTTMSPELHSKIYDYRDALLMAQNLAETWRAFYASRAADRAVVIEVWDTTTSPGRVGVYATDSEISDRIVWD